MDLGDKRNDSSFAAFQDFSDAMVHGGKITRENNVTQQSDLAGLPDDISATGMMEGLQGLPDKSEGQQTPNFWTIQYYQKFFNVNTEDVVERVKRSMVPHGNDNYLLSHIRPNPDLYGPFWICVTLIFAIAINGNLAKYLQTVNSAGHHWRYDFHLVSYAATTIFLYACLLPAGLWAAFKWSSKSTNTEEDLIESYATPALLELICLYGYSLAVYVPVAFLWTIQINWLQWSLLALGTFLSGGVLLRSLLPVISGKHRLVYAPVILGMHLALAAGFMLYFFRGSSKMYDHNHSQVVPTVP